MNDADERTNELKERLLGHLASLGSVVVAFSGGVDSSTLLRAAAEALGDERALGVTVTGDIFPSHEIETAKRVAREHGLPHRVVDMSPMGLDEFRANPPDRCYHCKCHLFSQLVEMARSEGFDHVLEGGHADDVGDHRPGLRAVKELEVLSPLKELGFGKAEIRAIAQSWGLSVWDEPSAACLASRIPYGQEITSDKLARVDACEDFLRERFGVRQARVRHDGMTARIEVDPDDIVQLADPRAREELVAKFRAEGFRYVALDLVGYRTGSLNEALGSS